ncbi:MAG: SMP-30/gluconolactonase/LRE family protein [Flavisolibacter sp.]
MVKLFTMLAVLTSINMAAQPSVEKIFMISDPLLVPEGIATDPRNGFIYVSSIAKKKIVVFRNDELQADFISTGKDGFLEGLGMKVDTSRNLLWAISVSTASKKFVSQLHGFDLTTGNTRYKYIMEDSLPMMFNDLDIDKKGNIYITDTRSGCIYLVAITKKEPEVFLRSNAIQFPNGIAVGDHNQIYIASYGTGLLRVDIPTKTVHKLPGFKDTLITHGMDGLVYAGKKLMGVYSYDVRANSFADPIIIQYQLDEKGQNIIQETPLIKSDPSFAQPTTLSVGGNHVYILANSHLGIFNENNQSVKGREQEFKPLTILRYKWIR